MNEKILNEGNQIHNFIPYLVPVPVPTLYQVTVPVPLVKKLRFLQFRFHNTALKPSRNRIQGRIQPFGQPWPCFWVRSGFGLNNSGSKIHWAKVLRVF